MADPQSWEGCLQHLTGARETRLSCEMPNLAAEFLRPSHNQKSFLPLVTPYKGQVPSLINTTLTVQDDSRNPLPVDISCSLKPMIPCRGDLKLEQVPYSRHANPNSETHI